MFHIISGLWKDKEWFVEYRALVQLAFMCSCLVSNCICFDRAQLQVGWSEGVPTCCILHQNKSCDQGMTPLLTENHL